MKKITILVLWMGILLSCGESTTVINQEPTSGDSTYAKEFVKRAQETNGLLLPGIIPLIKNEQTAIALAEAILFQVYGEENIRRQRPYKVYKTTEYWVITGILPEGTLGGVFEIALDATDARVIGVTHGK